MQKSTAIKPKELNDKEWLFVRRVAYGESGHIGVLFGEIFPERCEGKTAQVVWRMARDLLKSQKATRTLQECRAEFESLSRMTPGQWIATMVEYRDACARKDDFGMAIRAHELIGKVAGHFVDRHLHMHVDLTEDEIEARLMELADQVPAIRKRVLSQVRITKSRDEVDAA
jgi:hypothetical protein